MLAAIRMMGTVSHFWVVSSVVATSGWAIGYYTPEPNGTLSQFDYLVTYPAIDAGKTHFAYSLDGGVSYSSQAYVGPQTLEHRVIIGGMNGVSTTYNVSLGFAAGAFDPSPNLGKLTFTITHV